MMDHLYEIAGQILAAATVGILAYLTPKANAWLNAHTSKATHERLCLLVRSFTRAAEQLFHDTDPTGEKRSQYVRNQLAALGIQVGEVVLNAIEAEVWEINTERKKSLAVKNDPQV